MNNTHFVEYENYCKNCIHKNDSDFTEPCNHCLDNPVNNNSRRPVDFVPTKEFEQREKIKTERERLSTRSRLNK